jgi:hypothetical protein
MADFEFDWPFRHAVFTNIEQQNLFKSIGAKKARRAGIDQPQPTFAILHEYIDEKMCRVVKQDPLDAMRALRELHWVLRSLVHGIKRPEFKKTLEVIEATRASIAAGVCQILVKDYRDPSTPKEDLPAINAALVEFIEAGAWPTWQADIARWGSDDDEAA